MPLNWMMYCRMEIFMRGFFVRIQMSFAPIFFSFRFAFSCSVSSDHVQLPKQSIRHSKFIYHLLGQNNHLGIISSVVQRWSTLFVYVIQGHTKEHLQFYKIFQRLTDINNYFWELVTFVIGLYYIFLRKKKVNSLLLIVFSCLLLEDYPLLWFQISASMI